MGQVALADNVVVNGIASGHKSRVKRLIQQALNKVGVSKTEVMVTSINGLSKRMPKTKIQKVLGVQSEIVQVADDPTRETQRMLDKEGYNFGLSIILFNRAAEVKVLKRTNYLAT